MKNVLIPFFLALVIGTPAVFAQTRPAAPPPPPNQPERAGPPGAFFRDQRTEKAAFLGLSVSPANPTLRQQLKLPKGMGLVVDFVEADSPAQAAGVQTNDILTKLNDQLLINPQQFSVLVRYYKPGDTIKLTVIREAQAMELSATLTEKELPVLDEFRPEHFGRPPQMGGVLDDLRNQARALENEMKTNLARGMKPDHPIMLDLSKRLDVLKEQLQKLEGQPRPFTFTPPDDQPGPRAGRGPGPRGGDGNDPNGPGPRGFGPPGPPPGFGPDNDNVQTRDPRSGATLSARSVILVNNDEHQELRLTVTNGQSQLKVTDLTTGKVTFEGPVDTAQERQAVPESARKQLEQLRGYFQTSPTPGPGAPTTRPAATALLG